MPWFLSAQKAPSKGTVEILPVSKVDWQKLNPARGNQSPQAGTLWGDRGSAVETGFLAKFVDGFSSPPHIHNATYRAVVIQGKIHNDDPSAEMMWMPPGSFWTQPKGEVHITAAKGTSFALVEIDQGPYLVWPPDDQFDEGERPVNIVPSNLVWVDFPDHADAGIKIAYLSGSLDDGERNLTFLKVPGKVSVSIAGSSSKIRMVVVDGEVNHAGYKSASLKPGSYFGGASKVRHSLSSKDGFTIYIKANGKYSLELN